MFIVCEFNIITALLFQKYVDISFPQKQLFL